MPPLILIGGNQLAAIRFKASSRVGQSGLGSLPQLTPSFNINLRLAADQSSNVVGMDFGDTTIYAMYLQSGQCHIAGSDDQGESLMVVFVVDGDLELAGGPEHTVRARRGDVWTFRRGLSFELSVRSDVQLVAVSLPIQVLEEFGIDGIHGLHGLDPNSSMLSPALGFLREIALQEVETPSLAAYFMEKLVHEMVGGIMLENRGARFSSTAKKDTFDQAMDHIAARAGDRSLTPATLAKELSLSLRQLQREFKARYASIATVILQHRIDHAVRQLKDPKLGVLSLDEIAGHSGFSSAVQMRRVLRDAGVGNPGKIREQARTNGRSKAASLVAMKG